MRSNGSSNGAVLLGQALTILRVSRGMNRGELGGLASVTPSQLSHYERGLSRPREETLDRILEALNLPLEAIGRAQEFAQHPLGRDGTLPPDERASGPAMSRRAALKMAQEVGKAFAHVTLAFLELQAGGWREEA
jgi:transcriptional regulator with XRE-family HTH domain